LIHVGYPKGRAVAGRKFMKEQSQEHHVLIVNGQRRRAIALEAAAYSLGRDPTNAIVLDFETVSRQHAILLRLPIPQTRRYYYRLIDGNTEGKPSANGIIVNGQRCSSHDLVNGDIIGFGSKITASYLVVSMGEAEFLNYLESITYQSLKVGPINSKETMVGLDIMAQDLSPASSEPKNPTVHEHAEVGQPFSKVWIIGIVIILIAIVGASLIWMKSASQPQTPPQPKVTPTTSP
jgi:pSer/pThr/pTyr-binding forkhead associated (FHA) protein